MTIDDDEELLAMLGDEPVPAAEDNPFADLGRTLDDAPAPPCMHTNVQDNNVMRDVPPMLGGGLLMPAGGFPDLASALADCVQDESFDVSDLGSRVTMNEDGTCQLSDEVHCYHPLYRSHGCYEGRGINYKQARNGRSLFYICDQCGDKWNQIPPSNLKPEENPKVTNNSKRRTAATDPTRCGGYHCTTCHLKKNKKLARALGVQHCTCPKKAGDEEEESLGIAGLQPVQAPVALPPLPPLPLPMSESDAAKQAALDALDTVRACRMMGGAQFAAVDAIANSVQTTRKIVTAAAVQPKSAPVKRPAVVAASVCKTTLAQTAVPACAVAVAAAVPPAKKSRIRVTQLAGIGSTAIFTSQMRPSAKEPEAVAMSAIEKAPVDAEEEEDDDDGDTYCTYCNMSLDKDHRPVQYSVECSHRKCSACVCLDCAGFPSIKQARRAKQWFCRNHQL